jgi:hypothetical protein
MADILTFIPNHIVEIGYGGAVYDLPEQFESAMIAIAHRLRTAGVRVTDAVDMTGKRVGVYQAIPEMTGEWHLPNDDFNCKWQTWMMQRLRYMATMPDNRIAMQYLAVSGGCPRTPRKPGPTIIRNALELDLPAGVDRYFPASRDYQMLAVMDETGKPTTELPVQAAASSQKSMSWPMTIGHIMQGSDRDSTQQVMGAMQLRWIISSEIPDTEAWNEGCDNSNPAKPWQQVNGNGKTMDDRHRIAAQSQYVAKVYRRFTNIQREEGVPDLGSPSLPTVASGRPCDWSLYQVTANRHDNHGNLVEPNFTLGKENKRLLANGLPNLEYPLEDIDSSGWREDHPWFGNRAKSLTKDKHWIAHPAVWHMIENDEWFSIVSLTTGRR